DRKSTRLNSSHVKISYAVFGLKKKERTPGAAHPATSAPAAVRASVVGTRGSAPAPAAARAARVVRDVRDEARQHEFSSTCRTRSSAASLAAEFACGAAPDRLDEPHHQPGDPTWHPRDAALARARRSGVPGAMPSPSPCREAFFFSDPAPTEIYTLSLHDALPI